MFKITTTKTAARNGSGNVVAKGSGKQRTVKWDHSKSATENHTEAAHRLLTEAFPDEVDTVLARRKSWEHSTSDSGAKHFWTV